MSIRTVFSVRRSSIGTCTPAILAAVLLSEPASAGLLRVHLENPRYFANGSGRAIYLAGHQSFVDLQDNSFNKEFIRGEQRKLDWNAYLDFLGEHRFNYLRNWVIWSTGSGSMAPANHAIASPMPYRRVEDKGKARDGGGKFDLHQFDEDFFRRMRNRCQDLQERGIYVSIMLFEVYGFLDGEASGQPPQTLWDGNVFNGANNVNGIHTDDNGDGKGIEFFYTQDERIASLQRAYVRKVIDTVNHLDNIFYEVANELHVPDWQCRMIEFIKECERGKPKQHLVLMSPGGRTRSGQWQQMPRGCCCRAWRIVSPWQAVGARGHTAGRTRRPRTPASPPLWIWTMYPPGAATSVSSGPPSPGATTSTSTTNRSRARRPRGRTGNESGATSAGRLHTPSGWTSPMPPRTVTWPPRGSAWQRPADNTSSISRTTSPSMCRA